MEQWNSFFCSLSQIEAPVNYFYTNMKLQLLNSRLRSLDIQLPPGLVQGIISSSKQMIDRITQQIKEGTVARNTNNPRVMAENDLRIFSILKRIFLVESFLDEEFFSFQDSQLSVSALKEPLGSYGNQSQLLFTPPIFDSVNDAFANSMWTKHFGRVSLFKLFICYFLWICCLTT